METQSRSQIIQSKPIGQGLDSFRAYFNLVCKNTDVPTSEALDQIGEIETRSLFVMLFTTLQILPASRHLPSNRVGKNLREDLSMFKVALDADYLNIKRAAPLLEAVLASESDYVIWDRVYNAITESILPPRLTSYFSQLPWLRNTSSFTNAREYHNHVDDVSNNRQSIFMSALPLCCPFGRLPPEIRCLIYRILLRSKRPVRMRHPPEDEYYILCNNLYPSILGTCRLIYQEAHYVLYGENKFLAHRINNTNHNAALIRRARYRIGRCEREDGEREARQLVDFFVVQTELRFIELEFQFDLLEDPSIFALVCQAIRHHRHLIDIKIGSPLVSTKIGWGHCWRLWRIVRDQALILEWLQENLSK